MFFWTQLILLPIHMFPIHVCLLQMTYLFTYRTTVTILVSTSFFKVTFWFPKWRSLKPRKGHKNGCKEVTLKNLAVVFYVFFLQNRINQPNKQPVRPSSPRKKKVWPSTSPVSWPGLSDPLRLAQLIGIMVWFHPWKLTCPLQNGPFQKERIKGHLCFARCFKRSPVDTEGNIKHQKFIQVRGKSRSYCWSKKSCMGWYL